MEKRILFKHGVSINGELQVYKTTQYTEGDKIKHEIYDKPYSPKDVQKMDDFDVKSQQIVEAVYVQEILDEILSGIAYFKEKFLTSGFRELVRYDRMIDDLNRISVRKVILLVENGKIISKKYHRSWIMPGGTFLDKDILSKTLAKKFHTPENIGLFKAAMAANDMAFEQGLKGEAVIK